MEGRQSHQAMLQVWHPWKEGGEGKASVGRMSDCSTVLRNGQLG